MRRLAALTARLALLATLLLPTVSVVAAGPPFPPPVDGQRVYDDAGVLQPTTVSQAEQIAHAIATSGGVEVVVVTQRVHDGPVNAEMTLDHASALMGIAKCVRNR